MSFADISNCINGKLITSPNTDLNFSTSVLENMATSDRTMRKSTRDKLYNTIYEALIPAYNTNMNTETLMFNSRGAAAPIIRGENKMSIIKVLSDSGSFGIIYLANINGTLAVVKIPRGNADLVEFLFENIIQMSMYCYKDKVTRMVNDPAFFYPIPNVYAIGKTQSGSLYSAMQKLSSTFFQHVCVDNKPGVTDLFLQVCYGLYYLQRTIGFIHRDFHVSNVMVEPRPSPITVTYKLGGSEITIQSAYRVYFIDFGQVCVNFSKISGIPDAKIVAGAASYMNKVYEPLKWEHCKNNTYDMRMFIVSMLFVCSKNNLLTHYPTLTRLLIGISKDFIDSHVDIYSSNPWWGVYDSLGKNTPEFAPENVFKAIVDGSTKKKPRRNLNKDEEKCLDCFQIMRDAYGIECGENCDYNKARKKMLRLKLKHHPDKGGLTGEFDKINTCDQALREDKCMDKYALEGEPPRMSKSDLMKMLADKRVEWAIEDDERKDAADVAANDLAVAAAKRKKAAVAAQKAIDDAAKLRMAKKKAEAADAKKALDDAEASRAAASAAETLAAMKAAISRNRDVQMSLSDDIITSYDKFIEYMKKAQGIGSSVSESEIETYVHNILNKARLAGDTSSMDKIKEFMTFRKKVSKMYGDAYMYYSKYPDGNKYDAADMYKLGTYLHKIHAEKFRKKIYAKIPESIKAQLRT